MKNRNISKLKTYIKLLSLDYRRNMIAWNSEKYTKKTTVTKTSLRYLLTRFRPHVHVTVQLAKRVSVNKISTELYCLYEVLNRI